eukprot:gene1111-1665_t
MTARRGVNPIDFARRLDQPWQTGQNRLLVPGRSGNDTNLYDHTATRQTTSQRATRDTLKGWQENGIPRSYEERKSTASQNRLAHFKSSVQFGYSHPDEAYEDLEKGDPLLQRRGTNKIPTPVLLDQYSPRFIPTHTPASSQRSTPRENQQDDFQPEGRYAGEKTRGDQQNPMRPDDYYDDNDSYHSFQPSEQGQEQHIHDDGGNVGGRVHFNESAQQQYVDKDAQKDMYRPARFSDPETKEVSSEDDSAASETEEEKIEYNETSFKISQYNPLNLGRQARVLYDDVWVRLNQLGTIMSSPVDDRYETTGVPGVICDYEEPLAAFTNVLVIGATGKVGRILIRKLLLRGYSVRVMVRSDDPDTLATLPSSVQVVKGDVGNLEDLTKAYEGCNKIVYCAGPRSSVTADKYRVDFLGVSNAVKAMQDYNNRQAQKRSGFSSKTKKKLFAFKKEPQLEKWFTSVSGGTDVKMSAAKAQLAAFTANRGAEDRATLQLNETNKGNFRGSLYTRGKTASMRTAVDPTVAANFY